MENKIITHNEAISELQDENTIDPVVYIGEACTRGGKYTKACPIGYPVFDGSLIGKSGMMGGVRAGDLIILTGKSGEGKCHGKGTKILMFDGSIKKVEDVMVGDLLMGDDGSPRNVLSLASGKEMMYRVSSKYNNKADSYTVNESHILSLWNSSCSYGGHGIKDISVKDYLSKSVCFKKNHIGYKTGVDFKHKKVLLDPYFVGLWLGDGHSGAARVTTMDSVIVNYLSKYAKKLKLKLKKITLKNNKANTYSFSRKKIFKSVMKCKIKNKTYVYNNGDKKGYGTTKSLIYYLKKLNLINNKHIPDIYKINSRAVRLNVLAGLIDSDGYKNNNVYQIIQKNKRLSDDIIFLCRSLGFDAHFIKPKKYKGVIYYRISINGDLSIVPVKLKRKKCTKRKQIKNSLHYAIKVDKIGVDNYYGFELDGNKRYLLGDFTVTHNTTACLNICVNLSKSLNPSIIFSYEMIIDNLYAKLLDMGGNENSFLLYTPKKNSSGKLDWVKEKIKEGKEKFGTNHVFIDHLDFLSPSDLKTSDQHRMVIKQICTELKDLAIELEVAIFLICHVRKVEGRQIEMNDAAESSSIFQLADFMFAVERRKEIAMLGGQKTEHFTDTSTIRMLKNRITGDLNRMEFKLNRNNIIIPL